MLGICCLMWQLVEIWNVYEMMNVSYVQKIMSLGLRGADY